MHMKTEAQIIAEYSIIQRNSLIVSFLTIFLLIPKLVLGFSNLDSFMGLSELGALYLMTTGLVTYSIFFYKYWKCPSCFLFPGGRWIIKKKCQKCHVKLK
jgi:hypothetical protein